jgi:hypothetical protein
MIGAKVYLKLLGLPDQGAGQGYTKRRISARQNHDSFRF